MTCRICDRDLVGICTGGKYTGRECNTAADFMLCKEGGGDCSLIPFDQDCSQQHAFPVCKTVNGKCECKCKGIVHFGLCEAWMEMLCKATGACRCEDGACTFPSPCANG
jgi:hypothetical protein